MTDLPPVARGERTLVFRLDALVEGQPLALVPTYIHAYMDHYLDLFLHYFDRIVLVVRDPAVRQHLASSDTRAARWTIADVPPEPADAVLYDLKDYIPLAELRAALRCGRAIPRPHFEIRTVADSKRAAADLVRREQLTPISRWLTVPLGEALVRNLTATPVRPNNLTALSILLGLAAAPGLARADLSGNLAAVALIILSNLLDYCDGMLARAQQRFSAWGAYADRIGDKLVLFAALFGILIGHGTARPELWPLGFGAVVCLALLWHEVGIGQELFGEPIAAAAGSPSAAATVRPMLLPSEVPWFRRLWHALAIWEVSLYALVVAALVQRPWLALYYFSITWALRWLLRSARHWRASSASGAGGRHPGASRDPGARR